ncbi:D-ornithine 4,5-aminomutase subunit beta [Clostridioides difficile]|nr:D-ornithine 4,5-aminomutase subunit beta [Clostridioides difficile]
MHESEGTRIEVKGRVPFDIDLNNLVIPEEPKVLTCLLYTSPSPRDRQKSRMPSSA